MAWINNKHETLGSTSDTMDTTSMTASQFGMFLNHGTPSGGDTQTNYSVNGVDTGSKYSYQTDKNGTFLSSPNGSTSENKVKYDIGGETYDKFSITYACDIADEEKLFIGYGIARKEATAEYAPTRAMIYSKYITTGARVTAVKDDTSSQSGTYAIGSNLSCLGDGGTKISDLANIQTNSIFETSDTGDHYLWNGTAWVQVA